MHITCWYEEESMLTSPRNHLKVSSSYICNLCVILSSSSPELHRGGVALGQAGEVVVSPRQQLPHLVGDGHGQRGHWSQQN